MRSGKRTKKNIIEKLFFHCTFMHIIGGVIRRNVLPRGGVGYSRFDFLGVGAHKHVSKKIALRPTLPGPPFFMVLVYHNVFGAIFWCSKSCSQQSITSNHVLYWFQQQKIQKIGPIFKKKSEKVNSWLDRKSKNH